jgi:hypothetical protein
MQRETKRQTVSQCGNVGFWFDGLSPGSMSVGFRYSRHPEGGIAGRTPKSGHGYALQFYCARRAKTAAALLEGRRYTHSTTKSFAFCFLLSLYTVKFTNWVPWGCVKGPTAMTRRDNEGRWSFNILIIPVRLITTIHEFTN